MNSEIHIDHDALTTLKEIMEDDFSLLIDTFIKDSTDRLASLAAELERGDADAVRRSAHSFKGSSSNIGAPLLADLILVLETRGNEGNLEGMQDQLVKVTNEFNLVRQELAKL